MKNNSLAILCFTLLTLTLISCKDKAKEATTTDAEAPANAEGNNTSETYTANIETALIEWKGFKPTGSHNGTIALESGSFEMNDGKIVGGSFNINMTSIIVKDIPADDEKNGKLLGHLKSPDFFNVAEHPKATFTITGMQVIDGKNMLSGNLAIKNITNNITFPVNLSTANNVTSLTSDPFSIDRSKWDVKYGSKSFFDNLGDKFINDDIELKIALTASKS